MLKNVVLKRSTMCDKMKISVVT